MIESLMVVSSISKGMATYNKELEEWVHKMKLLEEEYQVKLFWNGDKLDGSTLISTIKSHIVCLESRCQVQIIFLEKTNKKGETSLEEHGYQINSMSQKNNEEDRVMATLIKKEDIIRQIEDFTFCFNCLEHIHRIILYYSFFKNESILKITQMRLIDGSMKYACRSILRKRNEGITLLAKRLPHVGWLRTIKKKERWRYV